MTGAVAHVAEARAEGARADWKLRGACLNHDVGEFYPPDNATQRVVAEFCHLACPEDVRRRCLEYAIEARERDGVWGGTTERERAKLTSGKGRRR